MFTHYKLVKAERSVRYLSEAFVWHNGFGGMTNVLGTTHCSKLPRNISGYHQKTELLTNAINIAFITTNDKGESTCSDADELDLYPGDVLYLFNKDVKVDTIRNQMGVIGFIPFDYNEEKLKRSLMATDEYDHQSVVLFWDKLEHLSHLEKVIYIDMVIRIIKRINKNTVISFEKIDYRAGYNLSGFSIDFVTHISNELSFEFGLNTSINPCGIITITGFDNNEDILKTDIGIDRQIIKSLVDAPVNQLVIE